MIVGPASITLSPAGGPGTRASASASRTMVTSRLERPLPSHSAGQDGAPQPESARRPHHSAMVSSGSQFSSIHALTSARTSSADSDSAIVRLLYRGVPGGYCPVRSRLMADDLDDLAAALAGVGRAVRDAVLRVPRTAADGE